GIRPAYLVKPGSAHAEAHDLEVSVLVFFGDEFELTRKPAEGARLAVEVFDVGCTGGAQAAGPGVAGKRFVGRDFRVGDFYVAGTDLVFVAKMVLDAIGGEVLVAFTFGARFGSAIVAVGAGFGPAIGLTVVGDRGRDERSCGKGNEEQR